MPQAKRYLLTPPMTTPMSEFTCGLLCGVVKVLLGLVQCNLLFILNFNAPTSWYKSVSQSIPHATADTLSYEPVCCVALGLAVLAKYWFVTSGTFNQRHLTSGNCPFIAISSTDRFSEKRFCSEQALQESEQQRGLCRDSALIHL